MNISEQIKTNRKALGFTQEQLASYLGVSAPAVNKWEKGSTYPDIALLPALARLLKIDMNELFSFRETLSDREIALFANRLSDISMQENIELAFESAEKKIQEYPHCASLIYMAATILNGALTLAVVDEASKDSYEKKIICWLEQAADSQDDKIKLSAIYMLASKYIHLHNYAQASRLLEEIPDTNIDKTMLTVSILMHQNNENEAAVLLEGKIIQSLTALQGYLYKLTEIEEHTGNSDKADQIANIGDKMVELFGLWKYGAVVPHLLTAVFRKDTVQCVQLIKAVLEEAQKPWDMHESALYYRYPSKKSFENVGTSFTAALISEIKSQEEYRFLKDHKELKEILDKYSMQNPPL